MKKTLLVFALALGFFGFSQSEANLDANKWSKEKAKAWYAEHDWISGANFIPSTAINQLEMWQEDTYDAETIDRELGYAAGIGFNTMRVYLHSLAYKADKAGFKARVADYLSIAD